MGAEQSVKVESKIEGGYSSPNDASPSSSGSWSAPGHTYTTTTDSRGNKTRYEKDGDGNIHKTENYQSPRGGGGYKIAEKEGKKSNVEKAYKEKEGSYDLATDNCQHATYNAHKKA